MKCDHCDNEATVREVMRVKGQTVERNLCESCAREQGIASQPSSHLEALAAHFVIQPHPTAPTKPPVPGVTPGACTSCGLTFTEFKQNGLMGCPECYKAFEAPLTMLLERAHEGSSRHVGKVPRRLLSGAGAPQSTPVAGGPDDRAQRLSLLRKQLEDAVAAEQYERAAKLRDEMRRFGELGILPSAPIAPRQGNSGKA